MRADSITELLDYDPATGFLFWKRRDPETMYHGESWNKRFAGGRAGNYNPGDGYWYVSNIPAARICWCIHYGIKLSHCPEIIDHINGVRSDNRITNLRSSNRHRNNHNEALKSSNTSGFKNISRRGKRWRVTVSAYYKTLTDRHFECLGKALQHRNKIMVENHSDHACFGFRKEVE